MRLCLFALCFLFSHPTFADLCNGKVQSLAIATTESGHLIARIGEDDVWTTGTMRLCSITTQFGQLTTDQCKMLYSTLLAAKSSGNGMAVQHSGEACKPIADWSLPDPFPYHFFVLD